MDNRKITIYYSRVHDSVKKSPQTTGVVLGAISYFDVFVVLVRRTIKFRIFLLVVWSSSTIVNALQYSTSIVSSIACIVVCLTPYGIGDFFFYLLPLSKHLPS